MMKKKLVAGFMAATMMVSVMSTGVFAKDLDPSSETQRTGDTTVTATVEENSNKADYIISIPETVDFGKIQQPETEGNALMEIAEEEISCANSYDYILVNDTISNTLSRFAQIIHSNRYSRNCMKEFLDSYIDGEVKPHVQSYKEALL